MERDHLESPATPKPVARRHPHPIDTAVFLSILPSPLIALVLLVGCLTGCATRDSQSTEQLASLTPTSASIEQEALAQEHAANVNAQLHSLLEQLVDADFAVSECPLQVLKHTAEILGIPVQIDERSLNLEQRNCSVGIARFRGAPFFTLLDNVCDSMHGTYRLVGGRVLVTGEYWSRRPTFCDASMSQHCAKVQRKLQSPIGIPLDQETPLRGFFDHMTRQGISYHVEEKLLAGDGSLPDEPLQMTLPEETRLKDALELVAHSLGAKLCIEQGVVQLTAAP